MKHFAIAGVLLSVNALSGCSGPAIEGQVLDGFGHPIGGVTVSVTGTQFTSQSNSRGSYSVGYVPGNITVAVSKAGYTDTAFSVNIATESRFPAGPVTLFEIPKTPEIFVISGGKYLALAKASVAREDMTTSSGFGLSTTHSRFSIVYEDPASVPTLYVRDSAFIFVDNDPAYQALFRIDGCCLLTRVLQNGNMGFMMGDYRDDAQFVPETSRPFQSGMVLRRTSLTPGSYAFAPYAKKSSEPITAGSIYVFDVEAGIPNATTKTPTEPARGKLNVSAFLVYDDGSQDNSDMLAANPPLGVKPFSRIKIVVSGTPGMFQVQVVENGRPIYTGAHNLTLATKKSEDVIRITGCESLVVSLSQGGKTVFHKDIDFFCGD